MTEAQFAELARLGVVIEKLRACGEVEQAIAFLKKANNLATQLLGQSHEAVLAGRSSLAFLYFERAEYEEALEALNENLTVARNRWGDESDIVGQTLANMRMVQSKRLDEAADQLDKLTDVGYIRAVGNGLRDRYEETRELNDLHLAIQAAERALRLAAPDAEDHAADLNTLAAGFLTDMNMHHILMIFRRPFRFCEKHFNLEMARSRLASCSLAISRQPCIIASSLREIGANYTRQSRHLGRSQQMTKGVIRYS